VLASLISKLKWESHRVESGGGLGRLRHAVGAMLPKVWSKAGRRLRGVYIETRSFIGLASGSCHLTYHVHSNVLCCVLIPVV
jgi:hypothetical protein